MLRIQKRKRPKVIILGAGLAGLSAGYALKKNQYEVTILEARDRIGGRVDTRIVTQNPLLTIEMGGEWIGVNHRKIRQLCRELRLTLINHRLKMSLFYDGKYFKPQQWKFSVRWRKKLKRLVRDASRFTAEEIRRLDSIDWWHFLVANHIPRRDLEIIDLIDGTDSGEDIRFVSALNALADALNDHDCDVVKGGNWLLPKALARRIGTDTIHLNRRVIAVHQSEQGVMIECSDGHTFKADVLVCTLPASVAATIQWHPKLPAVKQAALAALDYCRIIKISIVFSHRFWRNDFEVATDTLADFIYHATQNQEGEKGILTAYAVGDRAYVLSNMTDQEKADVVCRALAVPFGAIGDEVENVFSYYWGDDPYVGGAYALFEKDHALDLKNTLREPFKRIYFAGEHTADCQGFMEGAVESGLRVAKAILKTEGK